MRGTQKEGTNTEKRQGSCRSHARGEKKMDKGRHVQQLIYQGIKPAPTSQEFYISSRRNWVGVWFNICGLDETGLESGSTSADISQNNFEIFLL